MMNSQAHYDKDEQFLVMQFGAIRAEILALKERVIRILSISISGIPLLVATGEKYKLDFIIIVSPLITAVVVLILFFEHTSIMRAGCYIRNHIDPILKATNIVSWEEFLEMPEEVNRDAEKYLRNAILIAFILYYVGGSILAYIALSKYGKYGNYLAIGSALIYGIGLPFSIYFIYTKFTTSTDHG